MVYFNIENLSFIKINANHNKLFKSIIDMEFQLSPEDFIFHR